MALQETFTPIALSDLHREAAVKKAEGWRFIQTHAVNAEAGVDLYYSFMKDGAVENLKVEGVTKNDSVPSVTDLFLAAFVFENEARELFGVDMRDIAIDFGGAMYAPAIGEPMTIVSPEMKAAKDKARKAEEAKRAKESAAGSNTGSAVADAPAQAARTFVMTEERRARLDAKLATMPPEKVAKVEAALKAREAEAKGAAALTKTAEQSASVGDGGETAAVPAQSQDVQAGQAAAPEPAASPRVDSVLESKIALLDPEKAQRIRTARAKRRGEAPSADGASGVQGGTQLDSEFESKLSLMDHLKAERVRAALAKRAARKGGE